MERIAVISDIHGNIPALQAVLKDIQSRKIERIFCLGDLVGKGPDSSEAIDMIRTTCEVTVKGNWDDFITKPTEFEALKWHQNQLTPPHTHFLEQLPFSVEFMMSGKLIRLFHASPRSLYDRIQPWDPIDRRLSMFENTTYTENILGGKEPDVVCYGDIHNAYVEVIKGKTLCNVGSVGNPLDLPQASYAILEGEYGSKEAGTFSIQLIRVPYDIELAVQLAKEKGMPDLEPYITELTTAQYRGIKKD
ncbi:metallophosphoesterase family protein [Bacillus sp. USDA818B3_A]|uniref:metallophosphoesterase family protein n=1 Tax=Bacillus sp. USDA818B3_A TaxID=2698834 RepID=UPI00136977B8|nr:metallophosphoesterase family protein [Bacillus sp. USDA818B3_A]